LLLRSAAGLPVAARARVEPIGWSPRTFARIRRREAGPFNVWKPCCCLASRWVANR
jgi:hypothetical protein